AAKRPSKATALAVALLTRTLRVADIHAWGHGTIAGTPVIAETSARAALPSVLAGPWWGTRCGAASALRPEGACAGQIGHNATRERCGDPRNGCERRCGRCRDGRQEQLRR